MKPVLVVWKLGSINSCKIPWVTVKRPCKRLVTIDCYWLASLIGPCAKFKCSHRVHCLLMAEGQIFNTQFECDKQWYCHNYNAMILSHLNTLQGMLLELLLLNSLNRPLMDTIMSICLVCWISHTTSCTVYHHSILLGVGEDAKEIGIQRITGVWVLVGRSLRSGTL
jgi:hypothetical protein